MTLFVNEAYNILHAMPEKAHEEFKTSKYVKEKLIEMKFKVKSDFAGTAVLAELDSGESGPVLAVRADMDALEFVIDEQKVMIHACGHDANTAMVLSAAKEIAESGIKKGKVMFLFQPAEETGTGAESVCKSGILEEVTEMIGIHFRSVEDLKLGQATPALTHSATGSMTFEINGKSSHGSRPHLGINSTEATVLAVNAINSIYVDSRVPYSAKVTNIQTKGSTHNIIPESTTFKIDIRARQNDVMEALIEKIIHAVENSVKAVGAEAVLLNHSWRPAAEFDENLVKIAKEAIEDVLDESLPPIITPGGEDFNIYKRRLNISAVYVGLGGNLRPGLHKPNMSFDLKALEHGRDILVRFVDKRLGLK